MGSALSPPPWPGRLLLIAGIIIVRDKIKAKEEEGTQIKSMAKDQRLAQIDEHYVVGIPIRIRS